MSKSPAYDLAYYIANTLGKGVLAVGVTVNQMPDEPTNCISVYEYGGLPASSGQGDSQGNPDPDAIEHPFCQVAVRNSSSVTAQGTAQSIHKSLDRKSGLTINNVEYQGIIAMQPPFLLKAEPTRATFAFNLRIWKKPS